MGTPTRLTREGAAGPPSNKEAWLAGRYRIVRELGRGSSGRVVAAVDTLAEGQPERAIKLVDRAREAELRWELDLLRGLSHPCLAGVVELIALEGQASGEQAGAALVCELAPGKPADKAVRALAEASAERHALVLRVACDVGSALAALHARGLTHGDVKPSNIVVRDDRSHCVLVDLGLASRVSVTDANEASERAATLSGTPAFMAPERFLGERAPSSDLFSLGATLASLLRGESDSPSQASSHASSAPAAPALLRSALEAHARALPAGTPAALAKLIAELLEPRAALRVASASQIVARVLSIAQALAMPLQPSIGGGVDEVATPLERAAAMQALPLVGHVDALASLRAALGEPGVIAVQGPSGSGRTRLVREAVSALQAERVEQGQAAPTYWASAALPEHALAEQAGVLDATRAGYVVHVTAADALDAAQVCGFLRSAEALGVSLTLVLERTSALPVPEARVVTLLPLRDGEVRKLLERALPGVHVSPALIEGALAVSAGLSGVLCRALALALRASVPVEKPGALRAALQATHDARGRVLVPPAARALATTLAVAGGALDMTVLRDVIAEAGALELQARLLREVGLASAGAGQLALRADLVAALRVQLVQSDARAARAIAGALRDRALDARAAAYVQHTLGDPARAQEHFLSAIAAARKRGEPERAAVIAAEALALGPAEPLALAHADALRAAGAYGAALATLVHATAPAARVLRAELARLSGATDREREAERALAAAEHAQAIDAAEDARAISARLAFDRGELERAVELSQQCLSAGRHAPAMLRAYEVLALCALARGDHAEARRSLTAAEALARAEGAVASEARVLAMQAQLLRAPDAAGRAFGYAHAAIDRLSRAVELADAAGERHAAASFLHNLGVQQLEQGQLGLAAIALREAARRLSRLGRPADVARALLNVGLCAQLSGASDLALDAAVRAEHAARASSDAVTRSHAACLIVELQLERGDRRAALASLEALDRALPDAASLPGVLAASIAARSSALHAQLGDTARSGALLELAQRALAGDEHGEPALEVALAQCRLARELGQSQPALSAAERARELAEREGGFDARLRAGLAAAAAARACGDHALANARLSDVRSLLDAAALSLPTHARAALRALPAYRAALEAAPAREAAAEKSAHDARATRLLAMAKRLAAEARLSRVHELVLDAAVELTGAERGYLVLTDRDGVAHARATRGLSRRELRADLDGQEISPSRAIVGRVLATGRPLSTVDAAQDARLTASASVHRLALRSVLAVPLRIRGELRGAIYLEDRLRPFAFGDDDTRLLVELSELAGGALHAAELVRAERRARKRLEIARTRLDRTVQAQAAELTSYRAHDPSGALGHAAGVEHGVVAISPGMQRALALALKVASSDLPVLLRGESGTGKELLARAIHAASPRKSAPFVSENCGAIQETLLESTLFGHVKGAFTGAERRHHGLFELADGGTLLLDEIAEMSPSMQVRLLRVLQDGEVRPVGGERARRVDVRVLAATHRDLEAMVREGRFREDLYYRLSVVTVAIPPLRERHEDLEPLVHALLAKHAAGRRVEVDAAALAALARCPFPGNVRQLENELRRALALSGDRVGLSQLSAGVLAAAGPAADPLDLRAQIDALERRLIRQALDAAAGNQTRAARLLGVSRFGLQKMIRRLGSTDFAS